MFNKENVNLLINCARSTENTVTHNHIFLLLGAITKISSECVSEYMPDLLAIIGLSATKQVIFLFIFPNKPFLYIVTSLQLLFIIFF